MFDRHNDAARWFAVLRRGLMTPEERAAYALWRSKSGNARAMGELDRIWSELESAAANPATQTGGAPALSRPARVAAMLSAASLMVGVLYRLNGSWWTTLDWWSR